MKWYEKGWVIFSLLFICFPAGVFLLWKYGNYRKKIKVITTIVFTIIFFIIAIIVPEELMSILSLEVFIAILTFILYHRKRIANKYSSVFEDWDVKIHDIPEQKIRIYRALHEKLILHHPVYENNTEDSSTFTTFYT